MKKDTIVGEVLIEYPDSFEKMERDEIQKFYSSANNRWGIIDRERHMVISVAWTKKSGLIGSLLADEKSFLKRLDKHEKPTLTWYIDAVVVMISLSLPTRGEWIKITWDKRHRRPRQGSDTEGYTPLTILTVEYAFYNAMRDIAERVHI